MWGTTSNDRHGAANLAATVSLAQGYVGLRVLVAAPLREIIGIHREARRLAETCGVACVVVGAGERYRLLELELPWACAPCFERGLRRFAGPLDVTCLVEHLSPNDARADEGPGHGDGCATSSMPCDTMVPPAMRFCFRETAAC
ncbi:MAG: hypothetical protein KGK10_09700 [Rhodospirillales bacterium]|nr:hypothetical protein [Rhodospirillales bacterium]